MKHFAVIILILLVWGTLSIYSQNTTKKVTISATEDVPMEQIEQHAASTVSENSLFTPQKIKIRGFDKKVSDSRESFLITNNTGYNISRIKIKLEYYDTDGNLLHSRTEMVEYEISDGETRMTTIPSFDKTRNYYYWKSLRPKRTAIPFKAAYKILRYDIIAE